MKTCPHCKAFILTRREEEIRSYVKSRDESSTADVVKKFSITLANAGNYLKRLSDLGFIWRESKPSPSGGIEYTYYRRKPGVF